MADENRQYVASFTEEDILRMKLQALDEGHMRARKPIVDRLVKIESLKPPKPMVAPSGMFAREVSDEYLQALIDRDTELAAHQAGRDDG